MKQQKIPIIVILNNCIFSEKFYLIVEIVCFDIKKWSIIES